MEFPIENPINTQISFHTETPLDIKLPASIVSSVLLVFVGVVGIFSLIMIYHWFTYGRNKIVSIGTTVVYVGGVLFFMGAIIELFTTFAK